MHATTKRLASQARLQADRLPQADLARQVPMQRNWPAERVERHTVDRSLYAHRPPGPR